ncbi:MAG: hypothetical protein LKI94_04850 [Sporolactobacillus sp.]|mgnify:CR=1 FL=1|jgi:FtsH-binding integral membrane protein|nr:hypothetical protein [Sporolactobacillus sp.]
MKKIKDERLQLITLKNIRIAFAFQTCALLAASIYTAFTKGPNAAIDSPVFLIMMLSGTLLAWLQTRVSGDIEASKPKRKKPHPYFFYVLIALGTGLLISLIFFFADRAHPWFALTGGGIFFICMLAAYTVMYYQRKRRERDEED